jgi:CRISPR-associated protein Cas1
MADLGIVRNLDKSNKFLFLEGYGVRVRVDDGKLVLRDGKGTENVFFPKRFPFDNVVVYGTRGSITFEAIRWLNKHNANISIINWNGRLLTSIESIESKQTKMKFKQYEYYQNSNKRLNIAKKFIEAKIKRTKDVLLWLKKRYPEVNSDIESEALKLSDAKNIPEIMTVEGRVAQIYWEQFSKIVDSKLDFVSRQYANRPFGAVDPVNALLNYGYALLESECRKSINTVGLDTHVGFVHEVTIGKEPLVYDLQEPFRWAIDLAVIKALENKIFNKGDFIRTESYNLKLRTSGAKKLTEEVQNTLNMKIPYQGMRYSLNYIIFLKARELSHYLLGKRKTIDFDINLGLKRVDDYEMRQKILNLSYSDAKKLEIEKKTLWNLKRSAESERPFKIYKSVREKLDGL